MSVRHTVTRQYQVIANRAARQFGAVPELPSEGWMATARKALGMSAAQLAARLGVTRARISQAEQAEPGGGVTLKTMRATAEAMGCRFVYAIIPNGGGQIEDVIAAQARKKAGALVDKASNHMALEGQALSAAQNAAEVERIAREFLRDMPPNLWADK